MLFRRRRRRPRPTPVMPYSLRVQVPVADDDDWAAASALIGDRQPGERARFVLLRGSGDILSRGRLAPVPSPLHREDAVVRHTKEVGWGGPCFVRYIGRRRWRLDYAGNGPIILNADCGDADKVYVLYDDRLEVLHGDSLRLYPKLE